MSDKVIAGIARGLAGALREFAYTRKDEDRKLIAALHTELCVAVKREEEQAKGQVPENVEKGDN